MKWFRSTIAIAALGVVAGIARGDLAGWIQHIQAGSPLESVIFKPVTLGPAKVQARRPPVETRPALAKLISAAPAEAGLYSLRALEAEQQLDFAAAEADWVRYAQLAPDKFEGSIALADFYTRRLETAKELTALQAAAVLPNPASERFVPALEQRSWKTFQRIAALIDDHLLGFDLARAESQAWIARYPNQPAAYSRSIDYAVAHKQFADAEHVASQYAAAFPNDAVFPVRAQAQIEAARGSTQTALSLYDRTFQPLWPPELVKSYFELLGKTGSLRRYLETARRATESNPGDLNGPARIFYYWQQQANLAGAQRALMDYESRKAAAETAWTGDQLWTLAQLYETANNPDRATRAYYALYTLPGAPASDAERALAGLANLLFNSAGQGIRFGSDDLAYYRDIAQADPYPGFLNGILSLLLNTTEPSYRYSEESQHAQPYFHRARAAGLVTLFDARFPNSQERPSLHARRINAYSIHGDSAAVISAGKQFRAEFPNAPQRTEVATLMADSYARLNQAPAEFALYNELLQELAKRAEGMPLGEQIAPAAAPVPENPDRPEQPHPSNARSPEYSRILDRYIARLVSLKRIPDVLALYRREMDRNPDDPGLYERFAAFLDHNRLGAEAESAYRRAIAQFPDKSWSHKLARWYLRRKQTAQFTQLTHEVAGVFSGAELESYFSLVTPGPPLSPALYLQLNLYAHRRFPHDLVFIRNLLGAYQQAQNNPAYDALLRENWFHAGDLRVQFFAYLSSTKKLDAELAALGAIATPQQVNANPPAAQMLADGEAWRAHYETAAPVYRAIAASYPASSPTANRAAAIHRSLATIDPQQTGVAGSIQQKLVSYAPGDAAALTYLGEIYADRDQFDRARPWWSQIANATPGRAAGYLESATVFWDYYQFDDALTILDQGRRRLGNPALFSYQAGAIYENKRQYDRALAEYARAALDESNDMAQRRLVRLARRPALRNDVERLTANLADRPDPPVRALALRTAVLDNQGRRADLEQLLVSAAARSSSIDTLEWIQNQGRASGLIKVQEAGMRRRVEITTDPVDRMRYQLALAHFYEDQNRTADAQAVLSTLYQGHPNTLGIVRAATDFYWRSGQQRRAVETLIEAANRAQPSYRKAFRLEAARKATEAGDTAAARQQLALLLNDEPFQSEYLSAMADTYARAGDDRGLRAFYQSTIDSLSSSTLVSAEKAERTAAMRRGLIPVLTRIQDYPGALDQYIEIVNRYPEDEQLTREAAAYASAHQLGDKLASYYTKTVAASPRDYRWSMVLARVDAELERFPGAIDAYTKATAIRPDRTDLWSAQAQLEERSLRFADAERNYLRLFELTYRNSAWMERVAAVRARLGQTEGAVAALRTAFIENRPERAGNYFAVATRLDNWGYVDQAQPFADKGAEVAGPDLITNNEQAMAYARVLGRARRYAAVHKRLTGSGIDPETAPALSPALRVLGETAHEYYTPEEKVAFGSFFDQRRLAGSRLGLEALEAAGIEDATVRWLAAWLLANPADMGAENQLVDHQKRRMRFAELGAQLEAAWKVSPIVNPQRVVLLIHAADAYEQAGDAAAEFRVLRLRKEESRGVDVRTATRLCILLARQPATLLEVANTRSAGDNRDLAANCAVERANPADALAAIAARGRGLPPVWSSAYTGLAGLYRSILTPQVNSAFLDALGSPIIGDRIGKPTDRDRQLAGEPWFYYGSRYGEYLGLSKQPNAADYLPAMLEGRPGNAGAYYDTAEYYRESGDVRHALIEYGHALELDPQRAAAHDRMAELLWVAGRHDEAIAEWKQALEAFNRIQDRGAVPPTFTEDVKTTLTHIGRYDVLTAARPEGDTLLKTYLKRNGTYMFEPLLEGILAASGDPAKGVSWLMELSQSAPDPFSVPAQAVRSLAVPVAQRDVLYQKLIDFQQAALSSSFGQPRENAGNALRAWQLEWLRSLVSRGQTDRAQKLLASIPEAARKNLDLIPLEIQIAAQANAVPALLAGYAARRDPPSAEALRNGASELSRAGQDASARRVLEFLYTRELNAHRFDASNFLGLAEIRLRENQTPAAVELLRRMNLLSGEPFDTLPAAAALLLRFGKNAEASVFLEERVKAVPWDVQSREQRAAVRKSVPELTAIAGGAHEPYSTRADAAIALRANGGAALTTRAGELDLLASTAPLTEAAVNGPYWFRARVEAASASHDPAAKIRLLRTAIAVDPRPEQPRLDLFRTALDQKRYHLAISAVPVEPAQGYEMNAPNQAELPEWQVSGFLRNTVLSAAERALVARGLGEAYLRLNEPERAVYYYRLSLALDKSPGQNAAIKPNLEAAGRTLSLKRANDQRRPMVTRNLEQPFIVRPRLTRGGEQ